MPGGIGLSKSRSIVVGVSLEAVADGVGICATDGNATAVLLSLIMLAVVGSFVTGGGAGLAVVADATGAIADGC